MQAYESMAARQQGQVVLAPLDPVLPSQYEIQNASPEPTASPEETVTWPGLYAIWVRECERRENTKSSYLAAMKLFQSVGARPIVPSRAR